MNYINLYYSNVIFIYLQLSTKNIEKERFMSIKLYLNCDTNMFPFKKIKTLNFKIKLSEGQITMAKWS